MEKNFSTLNIESKKVKTFFVLGGPGSGKGTLCSDLLKAKPNFVHLSAGELLRKEIECGSPQGDLINSIIVKGEIVPVEITVNLLKKSMQENGWTDKKFLIDGFPRNQDNLDGWEREMKDVADVQSALFLECSFETMIKRIQKRASESENQRNDDNMEVLEKRFKTFEEQSLPIIKYFESQGKLWKIDANRSAAEVSQEVISEIEQEKVYPNSLMFNHSPSQIEELSEEQLKSAGEVVDKIVNLKEERTFENTIKPLSLMESNLSTQQNNFSFYRYVSTNKDQREASIKVEEKYDAFEINLWLREDLYKAINDFKNEQVKSSKWLELDEESRRYVDKIMQQMERNGLNLSQDKKDLAKQLQKEISNIERQASQNINEDKTKIPFKIEELEGLSEDFINKLEKVENEENQRYISLKYPEILPSLRLCKNENTRKKLLEAKESQCQTVNAPLLEELVQKRHEYANLLGYSSLSEYILSIRMAKSPINVQNFLENLTIKISQKGREELDKIIQIKRDNVNDQTTTINPWDTSFYDNFQKEKFYQIDEEKIKQYFPTQHVIDTTLQIYQELLSLQFKKVEGAASWHKEVECFEVRDNTSQELLGHFYLDLYPRENKYGHAAVFPLIKRAKIEDQIIPSAAAMVCNFEKPQPGKPSNLYHDDVETFFHEFGHVMHNMCTKSNYSRFSGTSVERDFVELPSQMLENWVWNKDIMKRLSKHNITGESLPVELIDKKIEAKNLNQAIFTLRQLFYGTFDFLLHSASDQKLLDIEYKKDQTYQIGNLRKEIIKDGYKVNTQELYKKLKPILTFLPQMEGTNPACSFGHILGGYESQYYGYLWSQVYSCDLFDKFEKEGIMNPKVGLEYRNLILAPGGSIDSDLSLKKFLGRDPSDDAFLRQNNFL